MARINIEDSLYKDRRWTKLVIKVGCESKALGILVGAWALAQGHWLKSKSIPSKAWPAEYEILIECELANRLDDGSIYVKGSKKAFAWLEQKAEAGRKGGLKTASAKHTLPPAKRGKAAASGANPPFSLLSSLPLSSDSISNSDSSINTYPDLKNKKQATKPNTEENRKVWEAYFNAYRLRYGIDPLRNKTVNSKISRLRDSLGTEEAIKVVEFYLTHNDGFYLKKTHEIGLCLKDADTLRTQMLRGKAITSTTVRSFEKTQSYQETLDRIEKEGI